MFLEWLGIIFLLVFVLPLSVYLCVKLGVLGYLRAKDTHKKNHYSKNHTDPFPK